VAVRSGVDSRVAVAVGHLRSRPGRAAARCRRRAPRRCRASP
jgi:hypothetical protein